MDFSKDIILYHGSRGGLEGDISVEFSRKYRDFGKGFYMGENKYQAAGLVIDDAVPVLYKLKLNLSEVPNDKILCLDGKDWVYTILANRNRVPEFSKLKIAKRAQKRQDRYDLVVGLIADDRMVDAMYNFENGYLTDKGIYHCLSSVKYGKQYVAKTEFACSKIEILEEKALFGREAEEIRGYKIRMRDEGENAVKEAMRMYRREGHYLDELIAIEQKKQREELER